MAHAKPFTSLQKKLIANEKQPIPPDLRRDVDPQVLRYYELRWRHETPGETLESFSVTATLSNPIETRRRIRTSDPGNQINEKDSVLMPGLSAQFDLRPHPDHRHLRQIQPIRRRVCMD